MIYPSLRAVEVTPIQHEGQQVIVVRDPEGLCQQSLAVPPLVFLVMSLLDGQHDVRAMQEALTRAAGGQLVTAEQIEQIVAELDEFYLLENERTAARRLELDRDYESLVVRPATHAGASYPEDEEACAEMFAGFFDGLDGGGNRWERAARSHRPAYRPAHRRAASGPGLGDAGPGEASTAGGDPRGWPTRRPRTCSP